MGVNDDQIRSWRGQLLSDLGEKVSFRNKDLNALLLDMILRRDKDKKLTGEGQNIFVSAKGYHGLGICASYEQVSKPAVQVGDKVAIYPGVGNALILRPCGNCDYKFVGPAFLPDVQ